MAKIRAIDMRVLDDLFEMHSGYFLDLSTPAFFRIFADEVGVDISAATYAVDGTSKAKRFRAFVRLSDASVLAKALSVLWDYRAQSLLLQDKPDPVPGARRLFDQVLASVLGKPQPGPVNVELPSTSISSESRASFKSQLLGMAELQPQRAGFEFERFLTRLFGASGLAPRSPFRRNGVRFDFRTRRCRKRVQSLILLPVQVADRRTRGQVHLCGL